MNLPKEGQGVLGGEQFHHAALDQEASDHLTARVRGGKMPGLPNALRLGARGVKFGQINALEGQPFGQRLQFLAQGFDLGGQAVGRGFGG